jgi:hypothetical protein
MILDYESCNWTFMKKFFAQRVSQELHCYRNFKEIFIIFKKHGFTFHYFIIIC